MVAVVPGEWAHGSVGSQVLLVLLPLYVLAPQVFLPLLPPQLLLLLESAQRLVVPLLLLHHPHARWGSKRQGVVNHLSPTLRRLTCTDGRRKARGWARPRVRGARARLV